MPRARFTPRRDLFPSSQPSSSFSRKGPRSIHGTGTSNSAQQNEEGTKDSNSSSDIINSSIQTVMAFSAFNKTLGCAVYDPHICKINLVEDLRLPASTNKVAERMVLISDTATSEQKSLNDDDTESTDEEADTRSYSLDVVSMLLQKHTPQLVILNVLSDKDLRAILEKQALRIPYTLQIRANDDFNSLFCKHVANDLNIPVVHKDSHLRNDASQIAQLTTSLLDVCPLSSACAGAIMSHIQRTNSLTEAHEQEKENVILALEIYGIANTMVLDSQTAQALGIFDRESHASVYSARTKEGFSLLSLLSAQISRPAKQIMSQWLTFPTINVDLINSRLDAVDLFTRIQAGSNTDELKKHVKGVKNIYALASSLISDKATVNTWKGITEFARNAIQIGLTCQAFPTKQTIAIFEKVFQVFDHDKLTFVHETIDAIIDWQESNFTQRVSVRHGLDTELDEYRQTYTNLPGMLEKITQTFVVDLEVEFKNMYNVATEYYPQIGFVTSLHRKDGFAIDQTTVISGQDQGWTYQYGSEVKAFFKNEFTKELDTNIGDVHSFISGREIEIIAELQAAIVQYVPTLTACGDVIAELECLLAFAAISMQKSYNRPDLVIMPTLNIKNGRHPLQELIVETFVPNDCALSGGKGVKENRMIADRSGDDCNSIMIITGANACGKSTYLKQLALIVIMAHIGCFIPADSAQIGVVDKIFTRMQVDESVNTSKGSFQTNMEQVANALNRSTSHSLLLFDEMCKGTLATDGVALFAATIRHLLRRGEHCPRTVAVTHFHEVFHENLLGPSMPITPAHMQIVLDSSSSKKRGNDDEDEDVEQSIVFLYKLRSGLELHSHAAQCAKICGIRQNVIDRAIHVSKKSQDHDLKALELSIIEDLAEDDISETGNTYTLRQKEQVLRAFTAWNIDADRQRAADEREMAFLDPAVALQRILNTPNMIQTTSTDGPSGSMAST